MSRCRDVVLPGGELQDLCLEGPRPPASPLRHRDHGQSRQSQSQSGAPAHPRSRGQALLPAKMLAGPEPDRTGLRQARALVAQGRRVTIGEILRAFTPTQCAN